MQTDHLFCCYRHQATILPPQTLQQTIGLHGNTTTITTTTLIPFRKHLDTLYRIPNRQLACEVRREFVVVNVVVYGNGNISNVNKTINNHNHNINNNNNLCHQPPRDDHLAGFPPPPPPNPAPLPPSTTCPLCSGGWSVWW